jgi:hypothetical protein
MMQYKANLSVLNSRYGDVERRVLLYFAEHPEASMITLSGGMGLLLTYLTRDGIIEWFQPSQGGVHVDTYNEAYIGTYKVFYSTEYYRLTPAGREFINHWLAAQPLDPSTD